MIAPEAVARVYFPFASLQRSLQVGSFAAASVATAAAHVALEIWALMISVGAVHFDDRPAVLPVR